MEASVLPITLDFKLTPELEAHEPPEARGLSRDGVRLLVLYRATNRIEHARFYELAKFLEAGDLLVINTSGTLNAALNVTRSSDGAPFELHLSTHLPGDVWVVELRQPAEIATKPYYEANPGESFRLPLNARVTLLAPYRLNESTPASKRLWLARLTLPLPRDEYLAQYGFPIRYNYVPRAWPSEYYQTVYATEPGSAEMPSAGRAFT
ncbi:MAG TPA: S-adenosylmethionine:tRNA ribosyltransferase-isomerase, partial [Anaerolineae bacterium]